MNKIKEFLAKHITKKIKGVIFIKSTTKQHSNLWNSYKKDIYSGLYDNNPYKKDSESIKSDWQKFIKF